MRITALEAHRTGLVLPRSLFILKERYSSPVFSPYKVSGREAEMNTGWRWPVLSHRPFLCPLFSFLSCIFLFLPSLGPPTPPQPFLPFRLKLCFVWEPHPMGTRVAVTQGVFELSGKIQALSANKLYSSPWGWLALSPMVSFVTWRYQSYLWDSIHY